MIYFLFLYLSIYLSEFDMSYVSQDNKRILPWLDLDLEVNINSPVKSRLLPPALHGSNKQFRRKWKWLIFIFLLDYGSNTLNTRTFSKLFSAFICVIHLQESWKNTLVKYIITFSNLSANKHLGAEIMINYQRTFIWTLLLFHRHLLSTRQGYSIKEYRVYFLTCMA